jgi:Ca2+-binding EF-hand superfamily protein
MRLTRFRVFLLCGGALLLLGPAVALSQPGGFPGGGQPGGGGPGGWGGRLQLGGGPGGPGGGFRDPNMIFNMLSGGKDVIVVSDLMNNPMAARDKDRIDSYMQRNGITNGQLTRDQFAQYFQERMANRGGPGGPGGGPGGPGGGPGWPGGAPGAPGGDDPRTRAWFDSLDQNRDGVLSWNEMPDDLRQERDRWDANRDGVISFDEFKEYAKAKLAAAPADGSAAPQEEKRQTVYNASNLSQIQGLPPWFMQYDGITSEKPDGQVGLYEWKAAGRTSEEFKKYDLNGDGFITVEEALRVVAKDNPNGTQVAGQFGGPGFGRGGWGQGGPGGFPGFGQGGQAFGRGGWGQGQGNWGSPGQGGWNQGGRGNWGQPGQGGGNPGGRGGRGGRWNGGGN